MVFLFVVPNFTFTFLPLFQIPLHHASEQGFVSVVDELLAAGADVNKIYVCLFGGGGGGGDHLLCTLALL